MSSSRRVPRDRTAERRILRTLADGAWHPEPELRTTFNRLQKMYLHGLIDGAMLMNGGTKEDRMWRLVIAERCPKCGKARIVGETCRHCGAA